LRQAEADLYHDGQRKWQILYALSRHVILSKTKKRQRKRAEHFCNTHVNKQAFKALKTFYTTRKAIRGDELLWKAHTGKTEFFNVAVTLESSYFVQANGEGEFMESSGKHHIQVARQID